MVRGPSLCTSERPQLSISHDHCHSRRTYRRNTAPPACWYMPTNIGNGSWQFMRPHAQVRHMFSRGCVCCTAFEASNRGTAGLFRLRRMLACGKEWYVAIVFCLPLSGWWPLPILTLNNTRSITSSTLQPSRKQLVNPTILALSYFPSSVLCIFSGPWSR